MLILLLLFGAGAYAAAYVFYARAQKRSLWPGLLLCALCLGAAAVTVLVSLGKF